MSKEKIKLTTRWDSKLQKVVPIDARTENDINPLTGLIPKAFLMPKADENYKSVAEPIAEKPKPKTKKPKVKKEKEAKPKKEVSIENEYPIPFKATKGNKYLHTELRAMAKSENRSVNNCMEQIFIEHFKK